MGKNRKVDVWNFKGEMGNRRTAIAEPVLPVKPEVMSWEETPSVSVSGFRRPPVKALG